MKEHGPRPPQHFKISVVEFFCVATILSVLAAILYPAVEAARSSNMERLLYEPLYRSIEGHPWRTIGLAILSVNAAVGLIVLIAKLVLPARVRSHFVWRAPPTERVPTRSKLLECDNDYWTLAISGCLLIATVACIVVIGTHMQIDRPYRRAIVSWQGPVASMVPFIRIAWPLSVIANYIFAGYRMNHVTSPNNVAHVVFASLGFVASALVGLVMLAMLED